MQKKAGENTDVGSGREFYKTSPVWAKYWGTDSEYSEEVSSHHVWDPMS
jgi:hypothetical protein